MKMEELKEKFQVWKEEHSEQIEEVKYTAVIVAYGLGALFLGYELGKFVDKADLGTKIGTLRGDGFLALTSPTEDKQLEIIGDSVEWGKLVHEHYGSSNN